MDLFNKSRFHLILFLLFIFLFHNVTPQYNNGYGIAIPLQIPRHMLEGGLVRPKFPQFNMPQFNPPPPFQRHFSLPSLRSTLRETLGSIGSYFLSTSSSSSSQSPNDQKIHKRQPLEDVYVGSASNPIPHLKVRPEEDTELRNALYVLGRNVLGKNMTNNFVQTVNTMGRFIPPFVYRDGRIILGNEKNSTRDGGDLRDVVCTTPHGNPGKCLDLSGCPSLLFDLTNLRKSLCFKALFVPGVCCPDKNDVPTTSSRPETKTTQRPRPGEQPEGIGGIEHLFSTRRPNLSGGGSGSSSSSGDSGLPSNSECGRAEQPSFRIVGGEKSIPGMYPWMAAIFLHGPKGTEFWCGGTLISKRYILTAAHCTKDQKQKSFSARQFTVRLGDYDLIKSDDPSSPETFRVQEIIAHPKFSGVGFYNDVALLKLESEVDYSRYISPICLPTGRNKNKDFFGTYPTVIGWGTNRYGGRENNALHEAKLPVWTNSQCDRTYFQPITDIFLCAGLTEGGKDACQGDSGGPLMLELDGDRWTQIGIVSFGNRCAEPGYPGVYTRITKFTDWIIENAI